MTAKENKYYHNIETKIYFIKMMEELGIRETSVNGESVYDGDVERLREYQREGLIAIRMKDEE